MGGSARAAACARRSARPKDGLGRDAGAERGKWVAWPWSITYSFSIAACLFEQLGPRVVGEVDAGLAG